jgi:type II secretory pathway component PulC
MTRLVATVAACSIAASALAAPQPGSASLPFTALPLRLTGVVADPSRPAVNACVIRCPAGSERGGLLTVGERACGVAEIREVRQDAVVIENLSTRRLELLTFHAPPAARAAGPDAATAGASARSTAVEIVIDVSDSIIQGYLANLPDLLSSALATPHYRDVGGRRVVDGYQLSEVRAGAAADRLGLRDGDVITAINGEALDGLPTVMRLFGAAQAASTVTATVTRAGRQLTLVVRTGKTLR